MTRRRIASGTGTGRTLRAAALAAAVGSAGAALAQEPTDDPQTVEAGPDALEPSPSELPQPEDYLEGTSDVATRTSRLLSRIPASVTVLSGDRLRALDGRFLTDPLRAVPGLEVLRLTTTESNVCARGFADDSSATQGILGLLDGRPIYNEFLGGVVWDTIPVTLDDIDRIEIVRGPGSFVHGPNAMHGVVSITTRSPLDYAEDTVSLSAAAGTYGSQEATLTFVKRMEESGFKGKAAWDDIDELDPVGEDAKNKRFGELRYETLLGGRSDSLLDIAAGISRQKADILIPTFAGLDPATLVNDMEEAFARVRLDAGDFRGRFAWTHFATVSRPESTYAPFDARMDTLDLDLQQSFTPWEGNTLTAGTGYHFAGFDTEDQDITDGRHHIGIAWVFLQDEAELARETLWLTVGTRFDWHNVAGGHLCPRLALVWKPASDSEQYLRASAGCGYRNPSLRELWFDMPLTSGAIVRGNRDLDVERMQSYEIGYSGRWGEISTRTSVEAVIYYNRVDDVVEFRLDTATFEAKPENVSDNDVYGGELEVRHAFSERVEAFANYSYAIRLDRETHERIPLAPRHTANAGVRVDVGEGVAASLWTTFFDDTRGYDPALLGKLDTKTDEYVLLNARVTWTFLDDPARATAFLEAFNMLDHDHREHPEGDSYGLLLSGGLEVRW